MQYTLTIYTHPEIDKRFTPVAGKGRKPIESRQESVVPITPGAHYSAREPMPMECDMELVHQFRRLSTDHRQAVREMVLTQLREQRK